MTSYKDKEIRLNYNSDNQSLPTNWKNIFSHLGEICSLTSTQNFLSKALLCTLLIFMGVGEVWGTVEVTYHIINLGRMGDDGQLTSTRTEALKFKVTGDNVTVGDPEHFDKYKSPLAKNWKYYNSSDLTGPLNVGDALSNGANVYVTYELDEDALSKVGLENGNIYRIKFPNNYYLRQTTWKNNKGVYEINTDSKEETNPTSGEYLWKFNIVDPYQITIQSQSENYLGWYLSSQTGVNNSFANIRLQPTLAEAKATIAWAFSLLPGSPGTGTYRLIVTDGKTASGNQLDSYGHGYLNNNRESYKTTYHLYNYAHYDRCDLTIEFYSPVKYTFHIINKSKEEAMSEMTADKLTAGTKITESMIPAILKSPAACNYTFYLTEDDAKDRTHELSSLSYSSTNIYVRYETSSSGIYLNEELKYNLSVGGNHYLFAADATTINSAAANDADDTYKWKLHGADPYKFTIENVGNNKFITYDVSNGEVVLSETGSYFFLHQSKSGKYELVAIPSNNYPTSYYTLGYDDTNGLKLYPNTTYAFENDKIQTVFTKIQAAIIDPLPTAYNRTYDGSTQNLVSVNAEEACPHGTIKYREGTTGEYTTAIPQETNAGTYYVYYMSVGNAGYEDFIAADPITVTIAPAPVTVTAADKTKVYGEDDPTLTATVTGLVNNESESLITYNAPSREEAGEDVGNYAITIDGDALQDNYAVSFVNGTLTISQKTVGITWSETSTFPYNGTAQVRTATATPSSLEFDDEIEITVTGEQKNVGNYTAEASALTGTKAGNYKLPDAPGNQASFSIVKASSINTSIVMTEWSYGDYVESTNAPSLSNNPDEAGVTYEYKVLGADDVTYVTDHPTDPGIYTVRASIAATGNHDSQIVTKDFTISKKALNKDAAGSPANGITVTVSKVITDQGTEQETITYPVTVTHKINGVATTLTPDDDYTLSEESSVSGHIITVTAKNENGTFTGNYTGFVKATYAEPKFWGPSGDEYAAVYLGIYDMLPNPVENESEIKAYIVNSVNPTIGTVTVSPVEYISNATTNPPTKTNYIPEGVPVLLLSNKENLSGFTTSSTTEDTSDITAAAGNNNQLRIAPVGGVPVKDTEAYVFYRGEFVLTKEGTINPGNFFLYNPNYTPSAGGGSGGSSGVRSLRIVMDEDEDPTGIDNGQQTMVNGQWNDIWYTLDGRRLEGKPTRKGIYITNGKKIYFK